MPADELAFALSRLRELASSGSSDEIRAFLGAFLPEAQMNGGANGRGAAGGVTAGGSLGPADATAGASG